MAAMEIRLAQPHTAVGSTGLSLVEGIVESFTTSGDIETSRHRCNDIGREGYFGIVGDG